MGVDPDPDPGVLSSLLVLSRSWGRGLFSCQGKATATRADSAPESRTGLPLPELVGTVPAQTMRRLVVLSLQMPKSFLQLR